MDQLVALPATGSATARERGAQARGSRPLWPYAGISAHRACDDSRMVRMPSRGRLPSPQCSSSASATSAAACWTRSPAAPASAAHRREPRRAPRPRARRAVRARRRARRRPARRRLRAARPDRRGRRGRHARARRARRDRDGRLGLHVVAPRTPAGLPYAVWLPLLVPLVAALMRARAASGLAAPVVSLPFPDVVGPVLAPWASRPRRAPGNVAEVAAKLAAGAAARRRRARGGQARLVMHHAAERLALGVFESLGPAADGRPPWAAEVVGAASRSTRARSRRCSPSPTRRSRAATPRA